MSTAKLVSASDLEKLRAIDSCTVSNAIERLNVRMRNEGFVSNAVQCRFPDQAPLVAYAATARIRTSSPPMTHRCYYDRPDWWTYVASLPTPTVMVLEDADREPGAAAFVGEIHAAIAMSLKCIGVVTNGAVRDLPEVQKMGFQMFSGRVSVSHSYAHITDFGEPVEIGGMRVASGDLIHGDQHGVLTVPMEVAGGIPEEAGRLRAEERELLSFCRSPKFSLPELLERIRANGRAECDMPWRPR